MKTIRIYTMPNEQIIMQGNGSEDISSFTPPPGCENLTPNDFISCDLNYNEHTGTCCDFPAVDFIDQLYIENGELKADINWEIKLMPKSIIYKKHKKRMEDKIDLELDNQTPNLANIMRWKRSVEKIRLEVKSPTPNATLYQVALDHLDENVANGQNDKILIRQKLNQKITELTQQ